MGGSGKPKILKIGRKIDFFFHLKSKNLSREQNRTYAGLATDSFSTWSRLKC